METVSYDEATRCPKCNNPGEEIGVRPSNSPRNSKIHTLRCMNPICLWYSTDWIVQELSDGTVPLRTPDLEPRRPKVFPRIGAMTPEKAREIVDRDKDTE